MNEVITVAHYRHRGPDAWYIRAVRVIAYGGMSLAGVVGLFVPPPALDHYLGHGLEVAWSVYLIVGGIGALVGVVAQEWLGEFVFLTLLTTGVGLYGSLVLLDSRTDPAKAVAGVLLLVLTLVLITRWLAVTQDARADARGSDPRE